MARILLIRGMLVGLVAGAVAFAVAKVLGETQVGRAVAFEASEHAGEHGDEVVSRTIQSTVGLGAGVLLYSVAIGGLFALAYAVAQGRFGTLGARATAALVALAGFVAVYVIPLLKYPANPPAVGDPDTIGHRSRLYLAMVLIAVAIVVGAAVLAGRLAPRIGGWNAAIVASLAAVAAIVVAYAAMPGVNEVPAQFPATLLWRFRISSIAIQASLWATLGLLFGALTERGLRQAGTAGADPAGRQPVGAASVPPP